MKKYTLSLAFIILLANQLFAQFTLKKLQTNYQTCPIGTDVSIPQFSWQMQGTKRGLTQIYFQIVVKNEKNQIVWDSKKVNSGLAHAIQYQGKALQATTRYTWKLTVWDNFGTVSSTSSWFETGFLNPNISAWSGAQWIGGGDADIPFYSHYLSVFALQFNIQIKENSQKAAFIFGANDSRLANKYLNLMAVENKPKQSYVAIELDISKLSADTTTSAFLNIYRVAYTATDSPTAPFKSIPISRKLINENNKYEKHMVLAECTFGVFEFYIDGKGPAFKVKDASMEQVNMFSPAGLNLNPVGLGGNFLSFPMLADIGFWTKDKQEAAFSGIKVRNFRSPGNIIFAENLHGKLFPELMQEKDAYQIRENTRITANPSRNATPMLRNTFETQKKVIKKARLYVTARGVYEMYINGRRVSDEYFNPGLTQYNKNHTYQTFDVTANLQNGKNAMGAWLSEGWWSGNITYSGENWNWFGDRQSLLSKLVITYDDGSEQIVNSNPTDWKLFTDGPVRVGSFFQGEVYDAQKEAAIENWTQPQFNDSAWKKVVEVPLEGNAVQGDSFDVLGRKNSLSYADFKLIGNLGGDEIRIVKTLTAKKVEEPRPKVFVYDMGQNMVGFPKIQIKNGKKGQVINIRYAEIKYPNLPAYKGNEGMVMMENIRAALTQDQYILKGGTETIQPRFTFHGYQFLEITGIDTAIPLADVQGKVISSVADISSSYVTNDTVVNKLWENITWSLRSNFLSIPTDCPQRNERMGWSGDISVFSKSATYLTQSNAFLKKHMLAMRDIQAESGRFTDVAPVGGGFGGTLWGSAGITVAYETYRQYGDIQLLQEHYEAMKKYIDFLGTKVDKITGILNEGPLGDWLSPEGNKNDNTLFWMAYYAYDLDIMSQMAEALGKSQDAQAFKTRSAAIKATFSQVYLEKNTRKTIKSGIKTGFMGPPNEKDATGKTDKGQLIDTQASYAIPIALGVLSGDDKVFAVENLINTVGRKSTDDSGIERPANSLMTGFIGTASIMEALSQNRNSEYAYELLINKQYPSWGYSVVNGATSIWERLNSYTKEDGFGGNNSMNSFNHYSFGSVAAWMYEYSLGIQRHPSISGFKAFVLAPNPDPNGQMTTAKGHYDSMYGIIESEWKVTKAKTVIQYSIKRILEWTYNCTVPPNTSAVFYLPYFNTQISQAGKPVIVSKSSDGRTYVDLKPGKYSFVIK